MNVMNNSTDEGVECPLCMEPLEVDDLNFYPCTCGYQICRFCWHRIRTDENELCPACRKAYPENPANFIPLSDKKISALKMEKRQRDLQRKQKITENRKHLANVRVVQKNLVFVVGLPPRLADADILKKYEYFGKYGKIHKVVINPSTTYAGVQGPSASAYVTYVNNNDALRAIQSVNNIMIDGRLIKTSLGTTKYCSHFMKNQQCPKSDCMYLHELGDSEASFTKEEMHLGKHQEYEKRLHDTLTAASVAGGLALNGGTVTPTNNANGTIINGGVGGTVQSKEAWPSLSTSPISKDQPLIKNSSNGKNSNKENNKKHDKTKGVNDKKSQKNQKSNNKNDNKENNNGIANQNNHHSTTTNNDTNKKNHLNNDKTNNHINNGGIIDDEINLIEDFEKSTTLSEDNDNNGGGKRSLSSSSSTSSASSSSSVSSVSTSSNSSNNGDSGSLSDSTSTISGKSSPGNSNNNKNNNSFPEHPSSHNHHLQLQQQQQQTADTRASAQTHCEKIIDSQQMINKGITDIHVKDSKNRLHQQQTNDTNNLNSACLSKLSLFDDNNSFFSSSSSFQPLLKGKLDNNHLNSAISSHLPDLLNGIDSYQGQTNPLTNGLSTTGSIGNNNGLIDNPEKYLLSLNTTEDWEAAFKYVMLRNNKQLEVDQQQQEELLRMQELQKRNNLVNSIGMPSLNGLHGNDFGTSDLSRLSQQTAMFHQQQQQQRQPNNMHHNEQMLGGSNMFGTNMSKFFDFHKTQQQHSNQHHFMPPNGLNNGLNNDQRDHLSMATLLENNRVNSQYLDHSNGLAGQQLQKQRLLNKYDQLGGNNSHNHMMLNGQQQQQQQHHHQQQQQQQPPLPPQAQSQQQQQNRIPNQYTQNSTNNVDDDLGFDPFIETQKALAELMENEIVQQTQTPNNNNNINNNQHNNKHLLDNCQRTRMPPPGFNHMNAFGFGVPRAQGSKILPFMNMGGNNPNNGGSQPQQQVPPSMPPAPQNNWAQHMNFQQPPPTNEQQMQHMNGQQNGGKSAYGNMSDWTAMDPAILSFRQFPSFSSHQQQPQQQQQQQHNAPDMFMQHLSQQNLPQSGQGFGHHGINLQNNILNPQQNSQAQVNYSHSNWLNNDQSLFMNNVGNGYTNNNYDNKFSIPMPPGIHSNNMNCMSGNKQQKTECIN